MERLDQHAGIPRARLALLFALFFCICLGLGYPSLNRVDWRTAGGLGDVPWYVGIVQAHPVPVPDDQRQYRILVPYLARPVYWVAQGHIGTWDPAMLGLLVVDSLFVAGTVVLLALVVMESVGKYSAAVGSALIYLLNFAVPNLRLAGFIDAGEGFFLMATTWCLLRQRYWVLPLLGFLGAMAKETFVPFLMVFSLCWWVCSMRTLRYPARAAAWVVASWLAALSAVMVAQRIVLGVYQSPLHFGMELHQNRAYFSYLVWAVKDRNLWYIFFWLLPLSLFRLSHLPLTWRISTAATAVTAFALDAYYAGGTGTLGRALFTVTGPLLSASVAILLLTGVDSDRARAPIEPDTAAAGNPKELMG